MKIAFIAKNLSHLRFFQKVASEIQKQNFAECVVINTVGYTGYDFEYELQCDSPRRGRNNFSSEISSAYDTKLSHSLRSGDVSKYIFADREIRHFNKVFYPGIDCNSEIWPLVKQVDISVGAFFEAFEPDFIVSEFIIGLVDGLFFEHSKSSKICRYINVRQSKMSKGLIFCVDNSDMPVRYLGDRKTPAHINKNSISRAIEGIKSTKSQYDIPFYMIKTRRNLVPDFSKFLLLIERISYAITLNCFFELKCSLRWYLKKMKNFLACQRLDWSSFSEIVDRQFFIFPLHYEPEQSVDIRGFPFSQLELIELISKNLPVDRYLVVKEHRGNRGYRAREDYVRLLSLPNVILVKPDIDNKELLKSSLGILTISGRMGWEALVQGKPLLVFGDSFYKDIRGIAHFSDIESLSHFLKNPNSYIGDESAILSKAESYEVAVRKGTFVLNSDDFLLESNVIDFVEGLCDFVSK